MTTPSMRASEDASSLGRGTPLNIDENVYGINESLGNVCGLDVSRNTASGLVNNSILGIENLTESS